MALPDLGTSHQLFLDLVKEVARTGFYLTQLPRCLIKQLG